MRVRPKQLLTQIFSLFTAICLEIKRNALGMVADCIVDRFACSASELAQVSKESIQKRQAENPIHTSAQHEQNIKSRSRTGMADFRHATESLSQPGILVE